MRHAPITITTLTSQQVPEVIDLIQAQQARQRACDPRLRITRSREQMQGTFADWHADRRQHLVALDAKGRVRGYARAGVWELSQTSILRAFLSARNGVAADVALPDPAEEDAQAVAAALLIALAEYWNSNETTGDLIRWPSSDPWLELILLEQGFRLDSVCAIRALQPLAELPRVSSSFVARHACSADEETLVALFEEELRYHERYTPFVRSSPDVLAAFRRKLARLWQGTSLHEGAPLVLVVEQTGEVVAMAENTLLVVGPDDEPGFTPPGCYGCIDNVSVREERRGQGIGHKLVQAIFDAFAATGLSLDSYLLWYNPDNPQAARFWPHLGFVPLWTTYQRLRLPASDSRSGT